MGDMGRFLRVRDHRTVAKVPFEFVRVPRARIAKVAVERHSLAFIRFLVAPDPHIRVHIVYVHRQRVAACIAIVVPYPQHHGIGSIVRVNMRRVQRLRDDAAVAKIPFDFVRVRRARVNDRTTERDRGSLGHVLVIPCVRRRRNIVHGDGGLIDRWAAAIVIVNRQDDRVHAVVGISVSGCGQG